VSYTYEYDDPYRLLAHKLIASERPADVLRILTDNEFILRYIIKETRNQDYKGAFTDCIIEDLLEDKRRMEYMGQLDALAEYYYSVLDKERLRKNIRQCLAELGLVC